MVSSLALRRAKEVKSNLICRVSGWADDLNWEDDHAKSDRSTCPQRFPLKPRRCLTSQLHYSASEFLLQAPQSIIFLLLNLRLCFCCFKSTSPRLHATKKSEKSFIHKRLIVNSQYWSRNEFHEWTHERNNQTRRNWNVNCSFFAGFSWSCLIENLLSCGIFFVFDLWCFDLNRKEFFL